MLFRSDLACGDRVLLLLPPAPGRPGIVVGRLAAYRPKSAQREVTITATESLVLRCGEASLDLRADGKVLLRGDDVLVRAKGTQRITGEALRAVLLQPTVDYQGT